MISSNLNNYGVFTFAGSTSARTADALSDFVLGLQSAQTQDAPVVALDNSFFYSAFVQDDWRILPNLTINTGIRWDIQTPPTDPQNKESIFIAGRQSTIDPAMPAGELVVGDQGVGSGTVPVRLQHISPRIGFACDPYGNGKTSVRASAGIFWGSVSALTGKHIGGYDEFLIDITDVAHVTEGDGVRLSVLCDNSPDLERIPSDLSDFTLYGGLYRSVHLVYVSPVSLAMVHMRVDAATNKPARIAVTGRLYNPTAIVDAATLTVSITDSSGHEIHRSEQRLPLWKDSRQLAGFLLDKPSLWSPKAPHLYRCEVSLRVGGIESVQVVRFGVRFFEFQEHGPFLLNGERLLIQGTHRHEDHAGYGAAMPAGLIREEILLIKQMGANFIRLAHYQQQRLCLICATNSACSSGRSCRGAAPELAIKPSSNRAWKS